MATLRDFVPLQKLGEGSFSTVYKVKRVSDGKLYALKKVRMNSLKQKERDNAVNEIRILASLQSPYIIGYKESIHDEKLNLLCIVMEYAEGGDLQKKIADAQRQKAFIVERQIWKAIVHVLKGLQVMHSRGILHRDLKSANVFLSDGCYKLGDLNVSKVNKGRLAYTQTGTPYYASPEVWRDEPYDSKSDIWSFGCIIYEMAALKPPFSGRDMEALYRNVQRCTFDRIPSCYSKDLETVIGLCMQKNPKLRPSSSELLMNPIVQKYAERLQMGKDPVEPATQRKELLRTIKVPLGLKGLQKNLPKANYEEDERQYDSYHPMHKQLSNDSFAKPEKNTSLQPSKLTLQKESNEPARRQLSPRLSPKLSPPAARYEQQSAKMLLQMRSHEKAPSIDRNRSQRLVESEAKKQYSSRREAEIRQLQKSLLAKQQQIEEYINHQLKRPLTAMCQEPLPQQRGPVKIYGKREDRADRRTQQNQPEDRTSKKQEQQFSSSRKREPVSDLYALSNKRKAESEGNVSYKKLQSEISRDLERRQREQYYGGLNKNVSQLLRREDYSGAPLQKNNSGVGLKPYPGGNKLERSRYARPESGSGAGKYQRYNIMPSWWG